MSTTTASNDALAISRFKEAAAESAAAQLRDGMVVGLGSGTTATLAVAAIGRRVKEGEIGHIDDEAWAIRYLIVDTQNWWPGKKVLISTRWIERISWEESKIFVNLTREAVSQAPEYIEGTSITRDHETKLHRHYNREGYWANQPAAMSAG